MTPTKPLISAIIISIMVVLAGCGSNTEKVPTRAISNNVPTVTATAALYGKNVVAEIFTGEW
jgi:hypothetical protein